MKKPIFAFLVFATLANLIVLIIAFTNNASIFYNYRLVIGILFLVVGGFLRRQILISKKIAE